MTIALLLFFVPSLKTIRGEKVESKDEGIFYVSIPSRIHHDLGHGEEVALGSGAALRRRLRAGRRRGAERTGDVDRIEDERAGRSERGKGLRKACDWIVLDDVFDRSDHGHRRNFHLQHRLRQHHDPGRDRRRHLEQDQSAGAAVPGHVLLLLRVFAAFVDAAQSDRLYQQHLHHAGSAA